MSLTATKLTTKVVDAEEVAEWFRSHRKPWPTTESCERLALRMNRMAGLAEPTPEFKLFQDSQNKYVENDEWWDFKASNDAVIVLNENLPAMLRYWGVQSPLAPERVGGLKAIHDLQQALAAAHTYIEFPFGKFTPSQGRKAHKAWHTAAIALYPEVGSVLVRCGHDLPKTISRNSVWASVTTKAIRRLDIPNAAQIDVSTVASFLSDWAEKCGGMTGKHVVAALLP